MTPTITTHEQHCLTEGFYMKQQELLEQLYKIDLKDILLSHTLPATGNKADLIERITKNLSLDQALNCLNYTYIKSLCSSFNINYQGKKPSISALCQLCDSQLSSNINPTTETQKIAAIQKKLAGIVGLEGVKSKLKDLIAFNAIQQKRKELGLESVSVGRHLVFTGNPGTGKTTIARIVGEVFEAYGLVSRGNFREVKRSDLVGEFIGKSENITQKILEDAKGGVLFIDEAYSLAGSKEDFGKVVIETIMIAMENYRDDMVIIVAGYKNEMEEFLNSNPGLKSRFNYFIDFDDYTDNELVEIMEKKADENDYILDKKLNSVLLERFSQHRDSSDDSFANGRLARNIFESMLLKQAIRLSKQKEYSENELKLLTLEDL